MGECMATTLTHSAHAFGDGAHPTTQLLLQVIEHLEDFAPIAALDMGCGSGILSLAIAARWPCPITAVDLEAESIAATRSNAEAAGFSHQITALQASGFDHPALTPGYDLIAMNILAGPLTGLAHDAYRHAAPDGLTLLSGILRHQREGIIDAYQSVGFEPLHSLTLGDWVALVMVKPA